jgi:predicted kinase
LGDATFHLLFHLANHAIRSGVSILIESPFYRGVHEAKLATIAARSRAVLIQCYAPQDVAARRFRARAERGERHPVHFDDEQPFAVAGISEEDWDRRARPLDLGIPTLVLDTTEGYVDDVAPILDFIRGNATN